MKTLILLDLDNVSPQETAPLRGDSTEDVIVAAAFSSGAGLHRWEDVEQAARRAAAAVAATSRRPRPRKVGLEVGLALAVPEAADHALLRLLRQAPRVSAMGPFDEVWVLSDDGWVRDAVARHLARQKGPTVPAVRGLCWDLSKTGGYRREKPNSPSVDTPTHRAPGSPTLVVDSTSLALGIRGELVQGSGDLESLRHRIERFPSVLTQVGITRGTTRGAARASQLPGTSPVLIGHCEAGDGLELLRTDRPVAPPLGAVAARSATGPGAVRLEWGTPVQSWTCRTALPWCVVEAGLPALSVAPAPGGVLNDLVVLHELPALAARVDVCFRRQGPQIHCDVVCRPGQMGAPAWWWSSGGPATAKLAVWGAGKLHISARGRAGRTTVPAVPARLGNRLILRSPLSSGSRVTASRGARAGGIIPARTADETSVALLVLGTRVRAGRAIPCMPIQDLDVSRLGNLLRKLGVAFRHFGKMANVLRTLPLVVPLAVRSRPTDRPTTSTDGETA